MLTFEGWTSQLALRAGPSVIAFTKQNQLAIVTWCAFEGSPALRNPLDATEGQPGSWPIKGNSAGVQNYTSIGEGLNAVLATLHGHFGRYGPILEALAKGDCACSVTEAVANSAWGTWSHNPAAASAAVTEVDKDYAAYGNRLVIGG